MTAIQDDPAGPAPVIRRGPAAAWRQMTSSFHHRNYRLFFVGQLISVIGTWMQTVAQSFR